MVNTTETCQLYYNCMYYFNFGRPSHEAANGPITYCSPNAEFDVESIQVIYYNVPVAIW